MKKLNLTERKGFAQIFLLVGMLLIAISLPLATKLVQQNQENRSNAVLTCVYTCTNWSACSTLGKQTCLNQRNKGPSGCTGGTSQIGKTQSCNYTAPRTSTPTCTYTCTAWTNCSTRGSQDCINQKKSPTGCTGGTSQIGKTRSCNYTAPGTTAPKCTWSTGAWSTTCSNGKKTRTVTLTSPSNCTGGIQPAKTTTEGCTNTNPTCTWTCNAWTTCDSSGKQYCNSQTKSPTGCTGGTSVTSRPCTYTAPRTCTYTCTQWGLCNSTGKKYCYTQTASPTGCTGGTKITSASCNYVAPAANTSYYYNDGTNCVGKVFNSPDACQASTGKTCYASKASCDAAHKVTCASAGGFCTYDVVGCTSGTPKGVANDGMGCSGGQICCTGKTTGKGNLYYFYSSGSCQTTSVYATIADCNKAKGTCYETESACKSDKHTYFYYSASVKSCIGITYASLADCNKVLGTCYVTKAQCDRVGLCGIAASDNRDHYPVSNHCVTGATYVEAGADKEGKDGDYNWKCTKNGVTNDCKAGTKKSGSGGGGGGSDSGYSYTGFAVSPKTLKLKVGESATVLVNESVTWSVDKADIATVTADGVVTGVAVGTATVTATNASGATATVAVTVIASDARTLSFKIAFAGVKPVYVNNSGTSYNCLGSLKTVTVEVLNRPTNTYEKFSDVSVSVDNNEVDSKGNQIFRVTNLEVGSSLASVNTFNYVKVKGPFHLKRRMCQDGQTGKLDETTTCDINLGKTDGVPYDFSEYTLLAGDVDSNKAINTIDFSFVKNAVDADVEPECGRQYDLNMDGVVNSLDLNLVKDALSSIDDE